MTKPLVILVSSAMLALCAPAHADGVTKTWVSSTTGSDTGNCAFVSPCKTFAYAITQTLAGGEIDVKDGGSYGPVAITKAVSIVNEGFLAQISVPPNGYGITIQAGANDAVVLQGLVIDGHNVGTAGISLDSANSLTISDCHIRNMTSDGIRTVSTAYLDFSNLEISNAQFAALELNGGIASLNGVDLHDNNFGINVSATNMLIVNSSINKNYQAGIYTADQTNIMIGNSSIDYNYTFGINITGGVVNSYGNNYIGGNGTDVSGGSLGSIQKR